MGQNFGRTRILMNLAWFRGVVRTLGCNNMRGCGPMRSWAHRTKPPPFAGALVFVRTNFVASNDRIPWGCPGRCCIWQSFLAELWTVQSSSPSDKPLWFRQKLPLTVVKVPEMQRVVKILCSSEHIFGIDVSVVKTQCTDISCLSRH